MMPVPMTAAITAAAEPTMIKLVRLRLGADGSGAGAKKSGMGGGVRSGMVPPVARVEWPGSYSRPLAARTGMGELTGRQPEAVGGPA
jgi:hypothetical protein